jgi:pimeloyl-ACP methyl ester carboxylesterase
MSTMTTQSVTLHPDVTINISSTETPDPASKKPTLVFLHFWGGSSKTWSPVISLLSPTYPTKAIDFRGWGASTGPDHASAYSISDLANDVKLIVNQKVTGDYVFIGHSMGAKVAQLIAGTHGSETAQAKAKLRGVVLICPAPPTPLILPEDMRDQQIHAYEKAEGAEFVIRHVLTALELEQHAVDALVRDMLQGNRHARAAWPAYAMGEDILRDGWRIDVPCLVLAAENDRVEPVDRVRTEVLRRLTHAQFDIIKGSGHLAPVEAPRTIVESVQKFLQEQQS